ncbi:MAG: dihydrodipicolinate synthase family protein [Verrucomicrobiaceae bacterium]|nr:dihydrodipicolinate synthase family protein [Verrucomicrobiaceae bacterium]
MRTTPVNSADLSSSVVAVPPLCRRADRSIDVEENRKLISHLENGGVRTLLYGGNANLYNMAVSEYALLLEMLENETSEETLAIPSIGPFFGNISDQAGILKGSSFTSAMVLPVMFPARQEGVASAVRHFVERSGIKAVLYIKDEGYISPELVGALVDDDLISWVKYAIVREDFARDDYLRELLDRVDPAIVVSGIGEQPAVVHLRDFGLVSFTSGCVCIAPSESMRMLAAIKAEDFEEAEKIRATFFTLENLRNAHGPIPVLHHAVALADIADTGSQLPLMADLDSDLMEPIGNAAVALRAQVQVS